jgi:hypothetical protein
MKDQEERDRRNDYPNNDVEQKWTAESCSSFLAM